MSKSRQSQQSPPAPTPTTDENSSLSFSELPFLSLSIQRISRPPHESFGDVMASNRIGRHVHPGVYGLAPGGASYLHPGVRQAYTRGCAAASKGGSGSGGAKSKVRWGPLWWGQSPVSGPLWWGQSPWCGGDSPLSVDRSGGDSPQSAVWCGGDSPQSGGD